MRKNRPYAITGLAAPIVCALVAFGCGDDSDETSTTSTSATASAKQKIDSAVESCTETAQELGDAGAAGLQAACNATGKNAKQAVNSGSANAKQALSEVATSCKTTVAQLPAGQAREGLTQLCDAIAAAGE